MKTIQDDKFTLVLEQDYFSCKSEQEDLIERICERLRQEFTYCTKCNCLLRAFDGVERVIYGPGGDPYCSKCRRS